MAGEVLKDMKGTESTVGMESVDGIEGAEASNAGELEGTGSGDVLGEAAEQKPERKYTDADVDRIIARKIAAERNRMKRIFNEEQQESELEKRERDVLRRELMADARDALLNEGLPSSLAGLINYADKESFEQSYQEVSATFRRAVQDGVRRTLAGAVPKVGTGVRNREEQLIAEAFAPIRAR